MLQLWQLKEDRGSWQSVSYVTFADSAEEARAKLVAAMERKIVVYKEHYERNKEHYTRSDLPELLAQLEIVKTAEILPVGETLEEFHDG